MTKRFRLIEKLVKAKCSVSGSVLRGNFNYATVSLLGQEIKKINKRCRDQAGLFDDFIIHQNTGGYEINPRYQVSFK